MGMRIRSFSDMSASNLAVQRVVADLGVVAFPLVGISAEVGVGKLSCFVEIPRGAAEADPIRVFRTQLRVRGYSEMILSVADLVDGSEPFGYLLVDRPVLIEGAEYQPDDRDATIAFVPELMTVSGSRMIGPPRCTRCNHAIAPTRARLIGSRGLCIYCQSQSERERIQ
jgi:hypothetical protein